MIVRTIASALVVGGLLGCGQGPSEGQLFDACMKQGGPMNTEKNCKCVAHETAASLPPQLAQAMVLDMQGKKQEAAALTEKMSFEERADFGMKQFEIVGKCLGMN